MKRIIFLTVIFLFAVFFNQYSNASTSQTAYQTYLKKLSTCSPYTYNVGDDSNILTILGIYNRKCVIKNFTYSRTEKCSFAQDELKKYVKVLSLSKAKSYTEALKFIDTVKPKNMAEKSLNNDAEGNSLESKQVCQIYDESDNERN